MRYIYLQGQCLIPSFQFSMCVDDILSNARIDGEIRHHKFSSGRKSERHLSDGGRTHDMIQVAVRFANAHKVVFNVQIRAAVVHAIQ